MASRRIVTRREWLSAAGLLALAGCAGQPPESPIWVGHLVSPRKRGESAINGIQQTLADLRDREFTIGGRSIGVRHVEAKDKARARAEASRLLSVNRVACLIVGPGVEGVADVVAIARSHGALAIVLDGTADRTLADQAVVLGLDPRTRGEMLARFAIAKGKRAYIRSLPLDNEVLQNFDREFKRSGGKEFVDPKSVPTDTVILAADGADELTKWKAQIALGVPLIRVGSTTPSVTAGEAWTLRMQPDLASLLAEGRAWADRYEKRFGAQPDDEAILGADAIALIADGLREIAGDDRRKLAEELMGRSEIAGLTGPIVRKDGRMIRPMWVERTVKGVRVGVEAEPQ